MTINRDAGDIEMVCDVCRDDFGVYPKEEFSAMIEAAKNNGWKVANSNGEWTHTCPGCVERPLDRVARQRDLLKRRD